jgi:hypothetical protein
MVALATGTGKRSKPISYASTQGRMTFGSRSCTAPPPSQARIRPRRRLLAIPEWNAVRGSWLCGSSGVDRPFPGECPDPRARSPCGARSSAVSSPTLTVGLSALSLGSAAPSASRRGFRPEEEAEIKAITIFFSICGLVGAALEDVASRPDVQQLQADAARGLSCQIDLSRC